MYFRFLKKNYLYTFRVLSMRDDEHNKYACKQSASFWQNRDDCLFQSAVGLRGILNYIVLNTSVLLSFQQNFYQC